MAIKKREKLDQILGTDTLALLMIKLAVIYLASDMMIMILHPHILYVYINVFICREQAGILQPCTQFQTTPIRLFPEMFQMNGKFLNACKASAADTLLKKLLTFFFHLVIIHHL